VFSYRGGLAAENTRAAYPIEYIPKIPCVGPHLKNVILLACDAFGVLPPVSKLNLAQTMYHFISGYTALVPGTEDGIKEPQATFSACFGAAFIVLHPTKYAAMLAEKMQKYGATGWLVDQHRLVRRVVRSCTPDPSASTSQFVSCTNSCSLCN
jgi:phosphoenolpyruvate carboxykinase (ATP)